jgi:hypothetical protein
MLVLRQRWRGKGLGVKVTVQSFRNKLPQRASLEPEAIHTINAHIPYSPDVCPKLQVEFFGLMNKR